MKQDKINKAINQICNQINNTDGKDWSNISGDTILKNGVTLKEVRLNVFYTIMGWK